MKLSIPVFVFAALLFVVAIYVGFFLETDTTTTDAITKCYDSRDNEIIGLECKNKYSPENSSFVLFLLSALALTAGLILQTGEQLESERGIYKW